jgi:ribonuclease-3
VTDRTEWAEKKLSYRFADPELLKLALTHRSASRENNERLEFLGDAFLNFIVAKRLCDLQSAYTEGELSRARASLVNRGTLAEIALELSIDSQIRMGRGELRSGGKQKRSVLADAFEALIGAILIDGRHAAAEAAVLKLYGRRFEQLPAPSELKDPKTQLQEWLQARSRGLPIYRVDDISGRDHDKTFLVTCELADGSKSTEGSGRSRRRAEQHAASAMLAELAGG